MKKIFFSLAITYSLSSYGQNIIPKYDASEYGQEPQAQNLYLDADKNMCELGEIVNVHIRMTFADKESGVPYFFDYSFRDPFDAPWKIGEFKVVSGGANIAVTEGEMAQVQMPKEMPKEKCVVVQVTLNPIVKSYKQVQVFATIYLEDNENVFYFSSKYLGINNEKYVIKNNGGAFAASDASVKKALDKKVEPSKPKIREYTVKSVQADVKASNKGYNINALTSNAKAIYAKDEDMTTILLNDDFVEMENGFKTTKRRAYMIAITVPGRSTGPYKIKENKKVSVTINLPGSSRGIACTCTDDPDNPDYKTDDPPPHPTCGGGVINITKYDAKTKIIEGNIIARLESSDPQNHVKVFYAILIGKFKVVLAN